MKPRWAFALLIALVASGLYVGNVLATPSSGLTTTILAKSLFDEFNIKAHTVPADTWQARLQTHGQSDVYVVDNKLAAKTTTAPGGTTGWHSHPGPSLILVVAGTVTNHTADNCAGQAYSAGSGFIDAGGDDPHMLSNDGSVQAETIAVQLLPTGAPRRIDEPAPANCQ
jgi:quercetin dioxygenase-like cupin family protein